MPLLDVVNPNPTWRSDLLPELLGILGEINAVLDPAELLPTIARQLRRIVSYKILDIFLPDADGSLIPALVEGYEPGQASRLRIPPGDGIVGAAAALREPVFVPDVSKDPRYIAIFPGVLAELAIPLVHQDRLIGVLNVEGPDLADFTPEAQDVLKVLASHLAVAIEHARLYDELRSKDARLGKELAIAQRIQRGLFPEECPAGPGWEASAHFIPALALGGDLYDFYETGPSLLGLAVGDVAGKGVPAALYGAFTSGSVRARAFQRRFPADLLEGVNRTLRRRGVEGLFCSLTYALFDFSAARVRLASSGLPHPLHYHAETKACEAIEVSGLPLGSFDSSSYEERTVDLSPGDVLVFHTDGVSEAWRGDEEYGLDRLRAQVMEHAELPAQRLGERILQDVGRFLDGALPADDVTLVVVKIL